VLHSADIKRAIYDCNKHIATTILYINGKYTEYYNRSCYLSSSRDSILGTLSVHVTHGINRQIYDIFIMRINYNGISVRTANIPDWYDTCEYKYIEFDPYTNELLCDSIDTRKFE
jgi:hypothetical protein